MMKFWLRAAAAAGALLLHSGVQAGGTLQGTEWKPERMAEIAVPEDSSASLQFRSKRRLVGFTGCNRFFAEYGADDGVIFIGPVAGTRMLCVESVMVRETALFDALANARTYQRDGARLVFFDQHNTPVLEMRQSDWD